MEAIRQLVIRLLAKNTKSGIVTTLPKKSVLDFQTMILAEKFMQNGVDPRMFKNADQAENMLKQIDEADKARSSGITETQSAKVFDLKGKKIENTDNIMGGEEMPPPGSRGGDEDIAAPFQSQEETLKNMIMAENKKNIAAMKQRRMLDEAIDDASPGFSGDRKTDAELVAENLAERMGLTYDDMPTKERLKLYDQAYTGLSKKKTPPEDMAQGGRAGYKFGIGPIKKLLDFANKKSPMKAYMDYLGSVKDRMKAGKEAEVAGEVIPIAATGALITNQVKKKLRSMNEDQRQKNKDEMFAEISQEYKEKYKDDPEFLDKMLLSLHENIYMDKKADGGRVGLKSGSLKKFLERRNFMKTIVGNSPEAENARMLEKILKEQKEFKKFLDKNPPVKFPAPGDKEYDDYILRLNQIMAKDRLKSATGGRIGLAGGGADFMISDAKKEMDAYNQFRDSMDFERFLKERKFQMEQDKKRLLEKKYGIAVKDGGRIGYKVGGFDKARRAFLKMLGIGAGTTAAAKSGILRFSDTAAPKVIEKVAEKTTSSVPPPYFFELAEKIKKLGKPDKVTYQERVEITRYTGKNGDEYELIEDLSTGDMQITKDKMGVGSYGDKSFDTIQDRSVLEYRVGRMDVKDEGLETQKGFKEADEYEEYKVEFDVDGTEAGADDLDAIVQKEIIEEAKGDAPSIKKASGGIARMLGE